MNDIKGHILFAKGHVLCTLIHWIHVVECKLQQNEQNMPL